MTASKSRQKTKRSTAKGALFVLGTLFLLSGVFRVVTEAGQAFAEDATEPAAEANQDLEDELDLARPERLNYALEVIRKREAKVAQREKDLEDRLRTLHSAEAAVRAKLQEMEDAEKSLQKTINLASEAAENDVAQLTRVYSNMKPKQAAALFEQMDASFAAGFLFRMPPENAAKVMAGLTPEKAYLVSVELGGRNADIPLE